MSIILPIVRECAVDWASLVKDVLEEIQINVPRSVEDSLMALNTYAKLPTSAFANLTTGYKDARVYSALLTSLDQAITEWPAALQRRVCASQVQRGGAKINIFRPLVEAVIVLYNAAVENLEVGMLNLAQVHADVALRHPGQVSKPLTTMKTRAMVHPNVNAKNAYRHFQYAHMLSIDVVEFLFRLPECDNADVAATQPTLSVYETVQLKSLLEVEELQALASLCIAVAKYVFALTDSIGENTDVLAKLAFAGASLQIPELTATSFPEICLLPSALLVAYHYHQAEYCYKANPNQPDMARALGHICYADELLYGIEEKIKNGSFRKDNLYDASKVAKMTLSLGRLLWRKFVGNRDNKESDHAEGKYITEGMESDREMSHRVSVYNSLLRYLSEGECSLVRLFPAIDSIVRRVYELYKQYQHENLAVYLVKPLPAETIQLDIPNSTAVELSLRVPGMEGSHTAPLTSFLHRNTFKDMPRGQEVNVAYGRKEETKTQEVEMLDQCATIENIVDELHAVHLPHEVRLCIEALGPCLEAHIGSVAAALQTAERTLLDAWKEHEVAAQLWADARKKCLGAREDVGFHENTLEVKKEVEDWCKSLEVAESDWLRFIGPLDFGSDVERLIRLLLPWDCRDVSGYIQEAEGVIAETRRVLQRSAISTTGARRSTTLDRSSLHNKQVKYTLENLSKLALQGKRLLAQLSDVMRQHKWWEKRQAAMRGVVLVIWGAPELKNKLTKATQLLQDECAKMNSTSSVFERNTGLAVAAKARVGRNPMPVQRRMRDSLTRDNDEDSTCYGDFASKKRHRGEEALFPHSGRGVSSAEIRSAMVSFDAKNTSELSSGIEAEVSNSLKARVRKNREAVETARNIPSKNTSTKIGRMT